MKIKTPALTKGRILLSRDAFREGVFARDNHRCVFCRDAAVDAHHVMERALFSCGGYYLDNGASVCEQHHLECEMTLISLEQVREACGIARPILPDHLYEDQAYDKWGNIVLPNGQRLRGELFYDESVQKILRAGGVLDLFGWQVKYPRTHHLPWSEGMHSDDRQLSLADFLRYFDGRQIVITEKMDGENTSLYFDGTVHARSIDGRHHPSRDWVKNFAARICHELPEGWRVCGENLFAEHSISYKALPSYFLGFSIWDERNRALSWDDTLAYFDILGITPVRELYRGECNVETIETIKALYDSERDWGRSEGYVLRLADSFDYGDFRRSVAKWVRRGHIQTTKHWMHGRRIIRNELAAS
ncbi:RNA ligase family protein [Geopseudomonas aromaticivorans]